MSNQSQRTEKATPQRVRKARGEGKYVTSKELVAASQFLVFTSLAVALAASWWPQSLSGFRRFLNLPFTVEFDQAAAVSIARGFLITAAVPILGVGMLVVLAGLATQFAVTGIGISGAKLQLDLARLNPAPRLRELPGQNLRSAIEAAVLLPLMAAILYAVVASNSHALLQLPALDLHRGTAEIGRILSTWLWRACFLLALWGLLDMYRQRRRYEKQLRMTKQEVREEWKQNEGNPEVRWRMRRLRRDLLRRKMLAEVRGAAAVIVNPTHFAVALKYDAGSMAAPKVIAKGKNYLALRIKSIAIEGKVPIVENKPLAQTLYKNCEVGHEIPVQFYRAVAEVLAYVYRIMGGAQRGE